MPPKKGKNKKRNSVVQIPKENGDVDSSLNSPAVQTPMSENQEFITPADRLDNPLDNASVTNGAATTSIDDRGKDGTNDAMAKAEGDEAAAAWGLDEDKGKGIVGEPDAIPDTAEKLENGSADHKPAEVNGEEPKAEEPKDGEKTAEEPKDGEPTTEEPKDGEPKAKESKDEEPKAEEPKIEGAEPNAEDPKTEEPESKAEEAEESKAEEPKDDVPDTKTEEPSEEEKKPAPPVDLDIPDTADANEHIPEEHIAGKATPEPEHGASKSLADELAAVEASDEEAPAEKAAVEEPQTEKSAENEAVAEKPAGEEPVGEQAADEEKVEAPVPEEPAASVEEAAAEASAPVENAPEPEAKVEEPEAVHDGSAPEPTANETAPEGDATTEEKPAPEGELAPEGESAPEVKAASEGETAPEVKAGPDAETAPEAIAEAISEAVAEPISEAVAEPAPEEPAVEKRPIAEAPKPATLASLTSTDRDFTSTRYQSTTSPHFLNKPHQPANHSLDLDDRNMQSSVNNWYKKLFSFADSLNWRPGWDYLEEFDHLVKSTEAALSQISLAPAQEWWAEKPKDPSIDWDKIDEGGAKYEEFWEWKSKIALTAICANFACREVFGKTVFGLDAQMTKKLGLAMSVFTKDFGDDITATKFRHMTLKLLQESKSFGSSSRKQLVKLSQELANVLSPLTPFLPVKEPQTEEEKQQQAHYSPLTLALYEKVLFATHTLHDTIQKDYKYFALFHPVPGVEFDETTMEESTFQGLGAGKGSVVLIARPGLARLGLPRGGEPEDIIIVHKALVVREDALEEGLKHFDTPAEDVPPVPTEAAPVEEPKAE